jgi:hypothetical protein
MRGDETQEASSFVDDCQAALLVLHCLGRSSLLIGTRSNARRVWVHEMGNRSLRWRDDQVLKTDDTYQPLVVNDSDLGDSFVIPRLP